MEESDFFDGKQMFLEIWHIHGFDQNYSFLFQQPLRAVICKLCDDFLLRYCTQNFSGNFW